MYVLSLDHHHAVETGLLQSSITLLDHCKLIKSFLVQIFDTRFHQPFCPVGWRHIHQWQHHEHSCRSDRGHLGQQLIECMEVGPGPIRFSIINFLYRITHRMRFLEHLGKLPYRLLQHRLRELDLELVPVRRLSLQKGLLAFRLDPRLYRRSGISHLS